MTRTPPPLARPGRSRRVHGEIVWRMAREAYPQGADPRAICERHRINRSTFRDRARREGWRRADIFDDAPPWTAMDDMQLDLTPEGMADAAWINAARAVARNRRMEARSWLGLVIITVILVARNRRMEARSWLLVVRDLERDGIGRLDAAAFVPARPADPAPHPALSGESAESPPSADSTAYPRLPVESVHPARNCLRSTRRPP